MSLRAVNREDLKDVLSALEAFHACGTNYYMIGALAREIWYARADKKFRTTKDVDFAILVGIQEQYDAVREYLTTNKGFIPSKTNAFVMIAPDKTQIDLLPFGALAIDDRVTLQGEGLTSIQVNGFMEVYQAGTETLEIIDGHQFAVAKLPSIVLLKLIAYDDRPEQRTKDARDIANIICQFFDLEENFIYEQHNDLFVDEQYQRSLEEISAIVIGREILHMLNGNSALYQRVIAMLSNHIESQEKSTFIRNMAVETNRPIEEMVLFLNRMLSGMKGGKDSKH